MEKMMKWGPKHIFKDRTTGRLVRPVSLCPGLPSMVVVKSVAHFDDAAYRPYVVGWDELDDMTGEQGESKARLLALGFKKISGGWGWGPLSLHDSGVCCKLENGALTLFAVEELPGEGAESP